MRYERRALITVSLLVAACNPTFERVSDAGMPSCETCKMPVPACGMPQKLVLTNCEAVMNGSTGPIPGNAAGFIEDTGSILNMNNELASLDVKIIGNCKDKEVFNNMGTGFLFSGIIVQYKCSVLRLSPAMIDNASYRTVRIEVNDENNTTNLPSMGFADANNPNTVTSLGKISFGSPIGQSFVVVTGNNSGGSYTLKQPIGALVGSQVTFGLFASCANQGSSRKAPFTGQIRWTVTGLTATPCDP